MVTMLTLFLDWRVQLSHRRGSGTAWCALAVATGLVLTGCGTESEPIPTATPTSTETAPSTPEPGKSTDAPEPTAEPTTTEPTPESAPPDPAQLINENTEEGAKSAAKYFLEVHNYSFVSLDLDLWDSIGSEECEFCLNTADKVRELLEEKKLLRGGDASIMAFHETEEFVAGVWELKVTLKQTPYAVIDETNTSLEEATPQDWETSIFAEFKNSRWYLLDIG
ncbi:DUF6318 family protein [Jonesiaceae bacterium BS-20]|uniref:DUF6318 family protein n=1 Tax=Jonesiaceae bacterium BS-20 TaxID=3120821 RepID=A0AAU7DY36_9MICO